MSEYSIAEARNNLPKLVDRAVAGEEVTITRRGKPVAQLVARVSPPSPIDKPKSPYDVEWIKQHIVTPKTPLDGGALVRQMRDDSRY